jgi:hypothetical protein
MIRLDQLFAATIHFTDLAAAIRVDKSFRIGSASNKLPQEAKIQPKFLFHQRFPNLTHPQTHVDNMALP